MNAYQQFGLQVIINASGSVTRLGGAPMPIQALQAFVVAAREWIPLEQLQAAASKRIAEATGAEAGLVASGCAAAITLGTAAIMTGNNPGRIEKLPHCDGFPDEFVIAREQRSGYDHAVRAAGGKLIEVGFNEIVANAGVRRTEAWEYEAAIGPNTAGIVYVAGPDMQPPLDTVVALAHSRDLPVLVDAAGELPPRRNLKEIPASGADLVAFSGGKAIRGPQSTGILCGRRDLIEAAALQMLDMDDHFDLWDPPADFIDKSKLAGIPRHGIGRGYKVSKEEIVALLYALDLFVNGSYDAELPRYRRWLKLITEELSKSAANCNVVEFDDGERWPILEVDVDEAKLGRSAFEVCRRLRNGTPPIYVGHGQLGRGRLIINPLCLDDEQAKVVARRLGEELSRNTQKTPDA